MTSLATLAAAQGGAFTVQQALDAGFSRYGVKRALATKKWHSLTQGVVVDQVQWQEFDANAKHLCRLHARLLVRGEEWVAARRTAALAHDLPALGRPPDRPQLVRPTGRGVGSASDPFERVAPLDPSEVVRASGPRRTSLARTVVDVAREADFRAAVVVADAALRRGLPPEQLWAALERVAGSPGVPRAQHVVAFADGLAETPLESISRVAFHRCALPMPEQQVEVWVDGVFVARVDYLWRAFNLVGEADGAGKYDTHGDLYAEKRRQDGLTEVGLEVVRWGWDEAWRPKGVLDVKVRAAMDRGRGRTLDPRVRFVPVTVQDLLRARR